jgi:hypothetical protein
MFSWLMLFRERIAVCSDNHSKRINTHYGQIAGLLNLKALSFKGLR